jgi:hypothetical protein
VVRWLCFLYVSHTTSETEVGILTLTSEYDGINRIPVIRGFAVRVTPIFTSKIHALNTLRMGPLLRSNVMQS